ncbi:alpha subunit of pyruvate dehydrogenase [Clydaea vesicula]|uniref:Pyruvate dehydrogenase E1 component subunit alpha n=1 Tax=Clydaea vesicula TaxID=447962 RepID=A0AAD5TWX6_9FUNG|nr:alpha subunit of pyruvate dehydrogenase [Clydaea vesicula]KAJ3382096.1 alpha subunit of pyruvate dehydrogenase [Lobulomyces angularis]
MLFCKKVSSKVISSRLNIASIKFNPYKFQTKRNSTYTITLPENTYETHNCEKPKLQVEETKESLINLYRSMMLIRRLELACDQLYKAKLIRGFCHLSTGQEALAAGMEAAIDKEDAVITAYRCHGFTLIRGVPAKKIIAELMGKVEGVSKGKGGSMHLFAHQFFGGNGIVGAQVPIGAGVAFTQKYCNKKNMTFVLYGDGAANQGQIFEAYNMSKLWNLPCVFVCENNQYAMGTPVERATASPKFFCRGDYIPGLKVDGNNVLAVKNACEYGRNWCLDNKGPLVMEMSTYRYAGHSMSDPGTTYRTREEIQQMRTTSDPLTQFNDLLTEKGCASKEELRAIDKECRKQIDQAVLDAKAAPEPPVSTLFEDVYVKGTEPKFIRGVAPNDIHYFT